MLQQVVIASMVVLAEAAGTAEEEEALTAAVSMIPEEGEAQVI